MPFLPVIWHTKVEPEAERWGYTKVWTDILQGMLQIPWDFDKMVRSKWPKPTWKLTFKTPKYWLRSADIVVNILIENIVFLEKSFVLVLKSKNVSWPFRMKFKTNREPRELEKFKLSVQTFNRSHILKNDSTLVKILCKIVLTEMLYYVYKS